MIPKGRGWIMGMLVALPWLAPIGTAFAAEPVAVITEIRATHGVVQVERAGEAEWGPTQPLLALRPGDELRAAGEGQAVVVFTGGRGPKTVTAATSPLVIEAPQIEPTSERLRRVLSATIDFLLARERSLDHHPLLVRHAGLAPLVMVSPRATLVLPGTVIFEWIGSDTGLYRLRVSGRQGILWEAANLPRKPLEYPEAAPPLSPGVWYTWELETAGYPVQRTEFEVLSDEAVARIRGDLDLLTSGPLPGYPASTLAVMRAGLLVRERLRAQARRELLQAIAVDPEEPTLHFVLAQVYDLSGLAALASDELLKARDLSRGRP